MSRQKCQRAALDVERHAGQGLAPIGIALENLVEANHAAASRGSDFNSAATNSEALKTPKSSDCSPTPMKRMGIFRRCAMARTTPPLAVPSNLLMTRTVAPRPF